MIFISGLCFVLILASTLADPFAVDGLLEQIMATVVEDLIEVAKAHKSDPNLPLKMFEAAVNALEKAEPEIKEIGKIGGITEIEVANRLADMISNNSALTDAIRETGKYHPRFIGALVLGITQVVTDTVKMILTRY